MNNDILLKKYLKKKLSPEEKELFDTLRKNDPNFNKEVVFQENLYAVIKEEERLALKKELQKLNTPYTKNSFTKWAIAAGFALLFATGSYYYFTKATVSNQELFAQNFTPATNTLHPVVRGEDSLSNTEKAFVYYENGNFIQFIKILTTTSYSNPDYDFFLANAYLAQGKSNEAIPILKKYLSKEKGTFQAKAHWYLGLAYLKEKNNAKAKEQFLKLENNPNFNYKKVKGILQKIK